MIPALIRGKLTTEQINSEDILTSSVFEMLQFVQPKVGLFRLLAEAECDQSAPPLPAVISGELTYDFWPSLHEGDCLACEPDVLISGVDNLGRQHVVLVEAKYRSPKSSYADDSSDAPNDQLAREWDNLVHLCIKEGASPHLIYITDHHGIPVQDIQDAAKDFADKRASLSESYPFACHWLSWRHIGRAFGGSSEPHLVALRALAERYNFTLFEGVSPIRRTLEDPWAFVITGSFSWPNPLAQIWWRFGK